MSYQCVAVRYPCGLTPHPLVYLTEDYRQVTAARQCCVLDKGPVAFALSK